MLGEWECSLTWTVTMTTHSIFHLKTELVQHSSHTTTFSENLVTVVDFVFMMLLTSQVISVAFCNEREKTDKFYSEALISAWGSFTCRKSTRRDTRLYFPSEGSDTRDIYALKKNPSAPAGFEPANLRSRGEYNNHRIIGVCILCLWEYFSKPNKNNP